MFDCLRLLWFTHLSPIYLTFVPSISTIVCRVSYGRSSLIIHLLCLMNSISVLWLICPTDFLTFNQENFKVLLIKLSLYYWPSVSGVSYVAAKSFNDQYLSEQAAAAVACFELKLPIMSEWRLPFIHVGKNTTFSKNKNWCDKTDSYQI